MKAKSILTIFTFIIIWFKGSLMAIETPKYKIITKKKNFEVRHYDSLIVAKTNIIDRYKEANSTGFRRIANYIFGGNNMKESIAMTAPVITTTSDLNNNYEVLFFMPSKYELESLPKPNLSSVTIEKRFLGLIASIEFGGWATEKNIETYKVRLKEYLKKENLNIRGNFMIAQYNSPWALPPFRRNEILVQIN